MVRCEERNKRARCCEGVMFVLVFYFLFLTSWLTDFIVVCRLSLTSLVSVVWRLNASLKLNSRPPSTRFWVPISEALLSKVVLMEWQVGLLYTRRLTEPLLFRFWSLLVTKHLLPYWHGRTLLDARGTGFVMFGSLERLLDGLMLKQRMWVFFDPLSCSVWFNLFFSRFSGLVLVR